MIASFRLRWLLVPATFTTALLIAPAITSARALENVSYPITDVWPGAVRFLRVDRNFPIREKDDSTGYILFDYMDGPKPCKGSLELIRITDKEGRDATRLALSVPDLPHRYEQMLLDKLVAKLRDDRGPPPPPPQKTDPPPPKNPDAGAN